MLRRSQRNHSAKSEKDGESERGTPSQQPHLPQQHQHDEYMMDDDAPPVLQPEAAPAFEEVVVTDDPVRCFTTSAVAEVQPIIVEAC